MAWLKRSDALPPGKLQKRLGVLGVDQVRGWADFYLTAVGAGLLEHTKKGDPRLIDEVEEAAAALLACVQELKRR